MTPTLFDLPVPMLHGYAAWEARNRIKVTHVPEWEDGGNWVAARTIRTGRRAAEEAYYNDCVEGPGCLRQKFHHCGDGYAFADSRDEAVALLCQIHGITPYGAVPEKPRRAC